MSERGLQVPAMSKRDVDAFAAWVRTTDIFPADSASFAGGRESLKPLVRQLVAELWAAGDSHSGRCFRPDATGEYILDCITPNCRGTTRAAALAAAKAQGFEP